MLPDQRPTKDFLSTAAGMLLAAITANLLWGSASPCIKLGYRYFSIASDDTAAQILFAGIRFSFAGFLTILLGSLRQHRFLKPAASSLGMVCILACLQTVIQYTFFYIGLSNAPSFKGSVISPSSTFFALLFAALIFRQEKLTVQKVFGCMVGFAGVILINFGGDYSGFRLTGEGFLLLAACSYGCSSVMIKRFSRREDPVVLSGWQFLLGGTAMSVFAFLAGGRLHAYDARAWLLMIYLALVSAVAYTLWSLLLQRHPVSRIMVFSFLNPVFGVFLSALLLGEGKSLDLPRCLFAVLLVCLGVFIVNRPERSHSG